MEARERERDGEKECKRRAAVHVSVRCHNEGNVVIDWSNGKETGKARLCDARDVTLPHDERRQAMLSRNHCNFHVLIIVEMELKFRQIEYHVALSRGSS